MEQIEKYVSDVEAFVPKDQNHRLLFKSGENYEAFLGRVIEGYKQKEGFRRFFVLCAWEFLRSMSVVRGTKAREASQQANVGDKSIQKKTSLL